MGHKNRDRDGRDGEDGRLYRLEVRGHLPRNRRAWLGAETAALHGPNTVLHLRVADQSDLFGRLWRIHDLNLQLISVREERN